VSESHVERAVQERIAAARRKAEEGRRRREELAAARRRGLAARHAAKLARLAEVLDNTSFSASGA
jgi:hypothetical protein